MNYIYSLYFINNYKYYSSFNFNIKTLISKRNMIFYFS